MYLRVDLLLSEEGKGQSSVGYTIHIQIINELYVTVIEYYS